MVLSLVWLSQQAADALMETTAPMSKAEVTTYLKSREVSSKAQAMFMARIGEMNKVNRRQQHLNDFFAADIPRTQRLKIMGELFKAHLKKFSLLQTIAEWHRKFLADLILEAHEEIYGSEHLLVKEAAPCKTAFHLLGGSLKVGGDEDIPDFTVGMWVGEMAFVNPELLHDANLTSKGIVELLVITAECFWKIISDLDLQSAYDGFLQRTVWTGVCGRCGTLGTHFSNSCPSIIRDRALATQGPFAFTRSDSPFNFTRSATNSAGLQRAGTLSSTMSHTVSAVFGRSCSMEFNEANSMDSFQTDQLHAFLKDIDLQRLIPVLAERNVISVNDLTMEIAQDVMDDPDNELTQTEKKKFKKAVKMVWHSIEKVTSKILAHSGNSDNHLAFISHFKKEAGTEATLMAQELEHIIRQSPSLPGHNLKSPCFVDSDNLRNLEALEWHVQNSHNLVLLLTPGVLTRPWVLIEIITAYMNSIPIVPVEIQRVDLSFRYPDDAYYERLRTGDEVDQDSLALLTEKGYDLATLEKAIRHVFNMIALPFSPHKATGIRTAEIKDVLKRCTVREGTRNIRRSWGSKGSIDSSLAAFRSTLPRGRTSMRMSPFNNLIPGRSSIISKRSQASGGSNSPRRASSECSSPRRSR